MLPPEDTVQPRRSLVLFFGDTSFELLDDKLVVPFDANRPRQFVDTKVSAVGSIELNIRFLCLSERVRVILKSLLVVPG